MTKIQAVTDINILLIGNIATDIADNSTNNINKLNFHNNADDKNTDRYKSYWCMFKNKH